MTVCRESIIWHALLLLSVLGIKIQNYNFDYLKIEHKLRYYFHNIAMTYASILASFLLGLFSGLTTMVVYTIVV